VIKINDKKKEEFKLLEDFFSDYYKSFHEHLFAENCHLECSESPDFIIKFDNQKIGIELIQAINEKMMKRVDLEKEICEKLQKYIDEEDLKIVIWLPFSDNLTADINKIKKSKFIKDFTEEFKKYIVARRNKEYSSFEEFCESNKNSLICKYLVGEPIEELYSEELKIREGEGNYVSINYYKEKLPEIINKKINKLSHYRKKVDKIYLLIITSIEPSKDLYFLADDIKDVREILNSYTKGENNFDKIFLYNENYYEPQIIKSD